MASIGEVAVKVVPDIDGAAARAAVLVAGVRLYDALYHADIEWLKALPPAVQEAYGDMQTVVDRLLAEESPEPLGLGAVVETSGGRFVRSDVETSNPWRGPKGVPYEWDDITDSEVTILAEGVAP